MYDRRDEIKGFGHGLALAVGLGFVSGAATVIVLVGWLQVADIAGTFQPAGGGLLATVAWWVVFWLALSTGLLGSLWAGYRAWRALYPVKRRRDETRNEMREEREAVSAAEAIVEANRSARSRDR